MSRYTLFMRHVMLAVVFVAVGQAQANETVLVDIAGSQRMLTQRILKLYCQIGLGEIYGNPERQLSESVERFEAQIAMIEAQSRDDKVKETLAEVKSLWPEYRQLAITLATREGAARLLQLNAPLLKAAHAVVLALEQSTGSKAGEIVNLSGRQRMLSQRMAMFYMLQIWGIEDAAIAPELKKATDEFKHAQARLSALPANTPRIRTNLMRVQHSLDLLQRTMGYEGRNLAFTVAMTTDRMLDSMNQVTAEYAQTLVSANP